MSLKYNVIDSSIPKLTECASILHNVRLFEKIFQENGGFDNRRRMKYWQDKADEWLLLNTEKIETQ